jgi:arylsulfatase A-like enzyme
VNLLPYLSGEAAGAPRKALYWRFGDQMAIRMGDWKLVKHRGESGVELYNLASDMGEQNDLAAKQPEKLKELQDTYAAWDAQLAKPTWGAPARRAARANRTR